MFLTSDQLCEELRKKKRNIHTDSRLVSEGDVFVALPPAVPGEKDKAQEHILMALEKGAWAVVAHENIISRIHAETGKVQHHFWLAADNVRRELGTLASARFGTENLTIPVIAVTGTNGKTTCAYLLEHLYRAHGLPSGVLGTISYRWPGHEEAAPLTTPGCLALHESLASMQASGAKAAIMEVSSHSIDQNRIEGIRFAAAAFTNLTQDHLDYHKTMENYYLAKRALFADAPESDKIMVINGDDPYGQRLLGEFPKAVATSLHTFREKGPCLFTKVIRSDTEGLLLHFRWSDGSTSSREWEMHSPLIGMHNASNLSTVCALALSLGFSVGDLSCLEKFAGVPGRLERIPTKPEEKLGIFVDYAHTPDALANVLRTLAQAKFRRIITVFGCGGDRDRTKRPLMGEAVAGMSDIAIVTSDNPRTEDPERIIDDIMPGFKESSSVYRESDRRKALELAVRLLQPGDALLVAGKGHEDYQIIGTTKHHFSDQEILKELVSC